MEQVQAAGYFSAGLYVLAATYAVAWIADFFSSTGKFWRAQRWAEKGAWVPVLQENVRSVVNLRGMIEWGYETYSKANRVFALRAFGSAPWLVLPASAAQELINRPDSDLDANSIHMEQIQIRYTIGSTGVHVMNNPIQFGVLKRQMTRKLPLLVPHVYEELDHGFREYWGMNSQAWTEVDTYSTCVNIVSQAANRAFAGEEICRNKAFLEHARLYTQGLTASALVLRLIPEWVKPGLAPLIAFLNRRHLQACLNICIPVVESRIQQTRARMANKEDKWEPPLDALQWLVEDCLAMGGKEVDARTITYRLLILNMTAIHTTSMTMTQTLYSIHTLLDADTLVATLRDECTRVLGAHGGIWSKAALNDLVGLDSTIRESMRFSDLEPLTVARKVVNRAGIDLNVGAAAKMHIPAGVNVCLPASSVHRDPSIYTSPEEFQPFRFASPSSSPSLNPSDAETKRDPTSSAVTTSPRFLAFGHGRHACPGRFFALVEMKLMLAYILKHYDVEKLPARPEDTKLFGARIPNRDTRIRVRRREGVVGM